MSVEGKEKRTALTFCDLPLMFTMRHPHRDSNISWFSGISVSLILIQHVNINLPMETYPGPKSYVVEDEINQTRQYDFRFSTSGPDLVVLRQK